MRTYFRSMTTAAFLSSLLGAVPRAAEQAEEAPWLRRDAETTFLLRLQASSPNHLPAAAEFFVRLPECPHRLARRLWRPIPCVDSRYRVPARRDDQMEQWLSTRSPSEAFFAAMDNARDVMLRRLKPNRVDHVCETTRVCKREEPAIKTVLRMPAGDVEGVALH